MRVVCGRFGPLALAFAQVLLTASIASAGKRAVVARGIGPGSDKAAALVGYYVREAFAADDHQDAVAITQALGNVERDKALRHFAFADGLFQKAREAYARLDLDVADAALRSTLARYERHAAYVHDYKKVAEALMLLGAVRILRGDERMGTSFLEQAINVYPAVEPDPRIFNPAMRVQFSQTATRLGTRANGTLALSSSPGAAPVWIDGRFVGVTPVVVENVSEGRHYVRIERDGYRPWGKVLSVGGNGESSDNAVLRPALHFEEYDALLDRAARSLDDGGGEARNAPTAELARLLGVDTLFLAEVRLDGERVRVCAQQFEVDSKHADKPVQHVFAYEPRLETYEREVAVLLRTSFGYGQGSPSASSASSSTSSSSSSGGGMSGSSAPRRGREVERVAGVGLSRAGNRSLVTKHAVAGTLTGLGGAAIIGGAIEYVLAKNTHDKWQKIPQSLPGQRTTRVRGINQALLGDVLMGSGVAVSLAAVLTWTLWHPDVNVAEVANEPTGSGGRRGEHSSIDFTLGFEPTPHGALVLPTWTF